MYVDVDVFVIVNDFVDAGFVEVFVFVIVEAGF
jgi:hypothetical protein